MPLRRKVWIDRMAKASDLKRGMVIDIHGAPHIVKHVDVKSPSSRGANTLYKIRFNNLQTGQKLDESLKGDDFFKDVDLVRAGSGVAIIRHLSCGL